MLDLRLINYDALVPFSTETIVIVNNLDCEQFLFKKYNSPLFRNKINILIWFFKSSMGCEIFGIFEKYM